jgi:hypothetical protein
MSRADRVLGEALAKSNVDKDKGSDKSEFLGGTPSNNFCYGF